MAPAKSTSKDERYACGALNRLATFQRGTLNISLAMTGTIANQQDWILDG